LVKPRVEAHELLYGALLAALAVMIPTAFGGWLQIVVGPFSATLASHVPTMLAMFISPVVAALVGIGSALGFLMTLGPVIAGRAAVHILIGVMGAQLVRRGYTRGGTLALTALPHAAGEAVIVTLFGFEPYTALVVVGLGTVLHHGIDSAITLAVVGSLAKTGVKLNRSSL
jgi:niacin transporter